MKSEQLMEQAVAFVMGILAAIGIVLAVYALYRVLLWLFRSIALARVGKRRKIKCWVLAWVPGLYRYVLGAVADDFDGKRTGDRCGYRILLPVLFFLSLGLQFAVKQLSGASVKEGMSAATGGLEPFRDYLQTLNVESAQLCQILTGISLLLLLLLAVFEFIAVYEFLLSCKPKRAVIRTVLYLLLPVARPFVLLGASCSDAPAMRVPLPFERPAAPAPAPRPVQPAPIPQPVPAQPAPESQPAEEPEAE